MRKVIISIDGALRDAVERLAEEDGQSRSEAIAAALFRQEPEMLQYMVQYKGGLDRAAIGAINAELNESPMSLLGMECRASR